MSAPPTLNATPEQASVVASLKGKVALVTGGESGIGQGCCIAMAKAGAIVIVTGRSELGGSISARSAGLLKGRAAEKGSETVRLIEEAGGKGEYQKLDVTIEDDWKRVIAHIDKTYGRLDSLVNNAGNSHRGALSETKLEDVLYMAHLNIEGAFIGTTEAWPLLKKSKGVVINMNSGAGQRGGAGTFAYPSSKGGMLGLTKGTAVDGRAAGVRVISLHPGGTWTTGAARAQNMTEDQYVAQRAAGIPLKRPAYPGDLAAMTVYLSSDAARHISGAEINVDGGSNAR